ncbi:hypothetical protein D3C73_1467930 [compost metagenome]
MLSQEGRQARGDLQAPKTHRGADAQMTGDAFPSGLETKLGRLHRREDVSAFVVVTLTFIGQGKLPSAAGN